MCDHMWLLICMYMHINKTMCTESLPCYQCQKHDTYHNQLCGRAQPLHRCGLVNLLSLNRVSVNNRYCLIRRHWDQLHQADMYSRRSLRVELHVSTRMQGMWPAYGRLAGGSATRVAQAGTEWHQGPAGGHSLGGPRLAYRMLRQA
jgi:hypothetical protein